MMDPIYEELAAPFETTHSRRISGIDLTYVTTEQVITRLNTALGVFGWSFEIVEHGYHESTDEEWVRGRLVVTAGGEHAVREQFGSQQRNKKRDGSHIEIGMDMKGAASDALKKCAAALGVGLYLSAKDEPSHVPERAPDTEARCSACNTVVLRGAGGRFVGGRLYCARDVPRSEPVPA